MILKFDPNQPVTVAFTYDKGKESPNEKYGGIQYFRKTPGGDSAYLTPMLEQKLIEMNYKAGEEVVIRRCINGKQTTWDVCRLGEQPERQLAGQPAPTARIESRATTSATPRTSGPAQGTPTGTMSTVMRNYLKEAVDLTKYTVEYAVSQGFPLPADMLEVVQKIAVSLYIQHGKETNIRSMATNQEARDQYRAPRDSDADFKQAGSQAAANAVAERKLAEMRAGAPDPVGPTPAWAEEMIANEDLSYMGDRRAV